MFYKVLRQNLIHHGFQYKEGLNVDTVPFNPSGDCEAGGLYFTDKDNVLFWATSLNCHFVADVTLPEDGKVYQGFDMTKWKADKLILSNIRPLEDFVSELSKEELEKKLKQDGRTIRFVKEQTPELCELAIHQNGNILQFINEQTPYICELAVKEDGHALEYVNEQTPYICELAVRRSGCALRYVKEQTPELCELAVRKNGWAIQFVKEQTPELCELAVRWNGLTLAYVKEQTPYLCELANNRLINERFTN